VRREERKLGDDDGNGCGWRGMDTDFFEGMAIMFVSLLGLGVRHNIGGAVGRSGVYCRQLDWEDEEDS
jgi:hypothetical protein